MRFRGRLVAAGAVVLALTSASGAAGAGDAPALLRWRPCPGVHGFSCATLPVPLDRSGAIPGTLQTKVVRQDRRGDLPPLVVFTGGPGGSSIADARGVAADMRPLLRDHRLVLPDLRGTGRSGALSCPELQSLNVLTVVFPEDVAGCARRLGPRRDSFATADVVDDLEALRVGLGAPKLALYGVSYGTFVEQQYARRYPNRVEGMVLDSTLAPGAPTDGLSLASFQAIPRVLRELCAAGRCAGVADDPVADLVAVVAGLHEHPLRGFVHGAGGARRTEQMTEYDLLGLLFEGDYDPYLRSRLPGALRAARAGDPVPLLRMRRDAAGGPSGLDELSTGLFAASTCADSDLGYSLQTPLDERPALLDAQVDAVPPAAYAPFSRQALLRQSSGWLCEQWPVGAPRTPTSEPLPDVPVLVLSGRADLRTPLENGRAIAAAFPRGELVGVPGNGHSEAQVDATGCVRRALERWAAHRKVGDPCRGRSNAPRIAAFPASTLGALAPWPGVPGDRGRVLRAAIGALADARTSANEQLFSGIDDQRGGGLRGGSWELVPIADVALLELHELAWVPGVRVSGLIASQGGAYEGSVHVRAPHGLSGSLRLVAGRGATGRLGGRRVRASAGAVRRARLARVG